MDNKKEEDVEFNMKILRMTPKAYLIRYTTYRGIESEEWMPVSQVVATDCWAEGDEGLMTVKAWIAKKKEIIPNDKSNA